MGEEQRLVPGSNMLLVHTKCLARQQQEFGEITRICLLLKYIRAPRSENIIQSFQSSDTPSHFPVNCCFGEESTVGLVSLGRSEP